MTTDRSILVTGASGFIGQRLVGTLATTSDRPIVSATRGCNTDVSSENLENIRLEFSPEYDYGAILKGVDTVIHLAANVHSTDTEMPSDAPINISEVERFFQTAINVGVSKILFVSSMAVYGNAPVCPLNEDSLLDPQNDYALEKLCIENMLTDMCEISGTSFIIIRPPMVYGARAKGSFLAFWRLVSSGLPLPFVSLVSRKSFIYVENLIQFILLVIEKDSALNQVFLVSDDDDVSLFKFSCMFRKELGMNNRLFYVPSWIFKVIGNLIRKPDLVSRFTREYWIDTKKAQNLLNWKPEYSVERAVREVVSDYKK